MNIIDYIEFEPLYYGIQRYEMRLTRKVLVHRVLQSTNPSNEKKPVSMSCNNWVKLRKYEKTVKRDHDSSSISRDKSSEIKREPTYINYIKDDQFIMEIILLEDRLIIIKEVVVILIQSGNITI